MLGPAAKFAKIMELLRVLPAGIRENASDWERASSPFELSRRPMPSIQDG